MSDEGLDIVEFRPSLNVAKIISDSIKLYFRGFLFFFPVILIAATGFEVAIYELTIFLGDTDSTSATDVTNYISVTLGTLWLDYFLQGLAVLPAIYLFREGHMRLGASVAGGLRSLIPVVVLSILAAALTIFGYLLLIIPGIIASLALFPLVPIIQVEKRGLSAIARSFELTQNYRTAIFGLTILVGILAGGSAYLLGALAEPLYVWIDGLDINNGFLETIAYSALVAATYTLAGPITFISAALTYLRLVEIKEGGEDHLLQIFE